MTLPQPTPAPRGDRADNSTDPANAENPAVGENSRTPELDPFDGDETDQPPQPLHQGPLFNTDKGITQ